MLSGYQNFPLKIYMEPLPLLTSPVEPMPSLSPPWSLHAIIDSSPEPPRCCSWPRSSPFTRHHLPQLERVTLLTMKAPYPSLGSHPQAHNNVVLPEPVMLCTRCHSRASDDINPRRSWARSAVALPEPVMPQSPQHRRARTVPGPAMPSSSPSPQGYDIVYISLSFWA
jgi:hypothetical protein